MHFFKIASPPADHTTVTFGAPAVEILKRGTHEKRREEKRREKAVPSSFSGEGRAVLFQWGLAKAKVARPAPRWLALSNFDRARRGGGGIIGDSVLLVNGLLMTPSIIRSTALRHHCRIETRRERCSTTTFWPHLVHPRSFVVLCLGRQHFFCRGRPRRRPISPGIKPANGQIQQQQKCFGDKRNKET